MVYPDLTYDENIFIDDGTGIHPFSTIGDNTLLLGAKIDHHCRMGSQVLLSACSLAGNLQVGDNSFIAISADVQQNTAIGKGSIIGMGSIIVSSTADGSVYTEPPATKPRVSSDDVKQMDL